MSLDKSPTNDTSLECPVCTKLGFAVVRQAYDDRYGKPELFNLVRCTHCGHLMTSPRLKESDLGALYSTYYPRKKINIEDLKRMAELSTRPGARLRRWCAGTDNQGQYAVRPGELMLDIGCGSGLSLLEARALGAEVKGIDADPNVQRLADELGLRIHIGSLLDEPFSNELFDLVVLNQVIEHLPDPALTLERLRPLLKKDGRIILGFPNVGSFWRKLYRDRWINWHVPYHLHHFNRSGFELMVVRLGYKVRSVRTITPNLWTLIQIRANKIQIDRGEPSSVWAVSSSPLLNHTVAPTMLQRLGNLLGCITRNTMIVAVMLPIVLVNRLVDAIGWGDSLLVEIVPAEMT